MRARATRETLPCEPDGEIDQCCDGNHAQRADHRVRRIAGPTQTGVDEREPGAGQGTSRIRTKQRASPRKPLERNQRPLISTRDQWERMTKLSPRTSTPHSAKLNATCAGGRLQERDGGQDQ